MNLSLYEQLAEPFPPEAVSWRVGATNKRNWNEGQPRKGKPLAYIDARDVMDRLDVICGPDGWQDEYTLGNGVTCCKIGIRMIEGASQYWVWKSDGAGHTDVEGDKGQFSDAFKRAAVKHGIGRYLYDCDSPWIALDERWSIPKDAMKDLNASLSKAANRQLWGDRSAYTAFRLMRDALEFSCKTPEDVQDFLSRNKGHIAQLRVGARRELEQTVEILTRKLSGESQ